MISKTEDFIHVVMCKSNEYGAPDLSYVVEFKYDSDYKAHVIESISLANGVFEPFMVLSRESKLFKQIEDYCNHNFADIHHWATVVDED